MSHKRFLLPAAVLAALALFPAGGRAADASADEARRVRALLVADTGDRDIGASVRHDLHTMRVLLEQSFAAHGEQLTLDVLEDRGVTRDAILGYFRKLRTTTGEETLLFYFAGHGATDTADPRRRHVLQVLSADGTRHEYLRRDEVREEMLKRRPRLTVLLTDACNNEIDLGPPVRPAPVRIPWETVRSLFLQPRGLVDINAVSEGESAVGREDGGFFTNSLAEVLGRRFPSWQELLPELQRTTRQRYDAWRAEVKPQVQEQLRNAWTVAQRDKLVRDLQQLEKPRMVRVYRLPSPDGLGVQVEKGGGDKGVRVVQVYEYTPAAVAGLKAGDVILAIDGRETDQPEDVPVAMSKAAGAVKVRYRRPGRDPAETTEEIRLTP
jgi:hypothetical protein